MSSAASTGRSAKRRTAKRSRPEQTRLLLAGAIAVLAIVFALLNLGKVEVDWILGTGETPLIIVIAVSILIGGLLGFYAGRRGRRQPAAKSPATSTDPRG